MTQATSNTGYGTESPEGNGLGRVRPPSAPFGTSSRARVRARSSQASLDVDGNVNIPGFRPRARTCACEDAKLECSWREACKAADYVLQHFGDRERDRGIWVWYCRRIGLEIFLDIADEVISCARQGEIRWPAKAFQRHLKEAFPKALPSPRSRRDDGGAR